MDFLSFLLCLLFVWTLLRCLLTFVRESKLNHEKLPPGPVPLPVIGNLFNIGHKPQKSLAELSKSYGPIMRLKLCSSTIVVVSSATIAKEILKKKDVFFPNRSIRDAVRAHQHNEVSMVWLPVSTRWRNLRKICYSEIFTSQKLDAMQDLRRQKVQELLAYIQECCQSGVAVDICQAGFGTSLNLISNTIFSVDLSNPCSDVAQEFKELIWGIMEEAGKFNIADYFPILRMIDPQGIRRRMTVHFGKMIEFLDSMIDSRLESRKILDSLPGYDVLDTLLNIIEDKSYEIERKDIRHLILDLFIAGTDTTSITLEWALAELLHNPSILSKARQEIEQTIGKGNLVEESNIAQLPYLQAIVKETLRLHPASPLLPPRIPESDVEVCSYIVPKNAEVLVNAWAIGRDPSIWVNPDSFFPDRFLGSDIDFKGQNFEFIPFGSGRRSCPGLPLANRMFPLMLASLIHSFDWKLENGMKPLDMDMEDTNKFHLRKAQPLRAIPVRL